MQAQQLQDAVCFISDSTAISKDHQKDLANIVKLGTKYNGIYTFDIAHTQSLQAAITFVL